MDLYDGEEVCVSLDVGKPAVGHAKVQLSISDGRPNITKTSSMSRTASGVGGPLGRQP